jgi:hypothetical protein
MYFSPLSFFHFSFGFVMIDAIAGCNSTLFICSIFLTSFISIFLIRFALYCFDVVMQFHSNRWSTHFCLFSTFKQFVMFPSCPFFCVMFSTLFKHIPEPVQNIALFFGWSSFVVTVLIILARLNATYSVPGFSSLVVKSPGSTIKCLNWSFLSKPASNP